MKRLFSSPYKFLSLVTASLIPCVLTGCGGGSSNNGGANQNSNPGGTVLTGNLATQAAIISGYQAFQGGVNYPLVQVQDTLPIGSPLRNALRTAAQQKRAAAPHDGSPVDALGLTATTTTTGNTENVDLSGDGSLTITQTAPAVSTINLGTYTSYPVAFTITADLTGGPLPFSGSGSISLLDASGAGSIQGSFTFPASGVSASADLTLDDNSNVGGTATISENGQTISVTNLSGPFTGTLTGSVTAEPQGDTGTATLSIVDDSFSIVLNTPTGTATGTEDSSGNLVINFPDGTTETINNPLTVSPSAPVTTTLNGTVVTGSGTSISPVSGDTVTFDGSSALSAVTNAQGLFSLTLPASAVTGHDTLTVFNAAGVLVQTQTITSTAPVTITLPAVPAPPSVGT